MVTFDEIKKQFAELEKELQKTNNQSAVRRARAIALKMKKNLHTLRLDLSQLSKDIKARNKADVAAGKRKARSLPLNLRKTTSSF